MILEVRNVHKSFADNHVLRDVSFSVRSNNTLGFLGRNGSGKTTAIRIIMNIIAADSGQVLIDGSKFTRDDFKMGYLPEERGLYQKVAVLEQMIYFGKLKGMTADNARKSALTLLEKLEISDYSNRTADTLSKGNQQKVQLAIALVNDPDILILDEPFSGLDPVNAKALRDVIEENARMSKVILFSSHQLSNVEEFCEDVCLIDNGRVVLYGNLREIKDQYPQEKLYIVPAKNGEYGLEKTLAQNDEIKKLIRNYQRDKNGFVITLREPSAKDSLLRLLTAGETNAPLRAFSIMEPSLLDIFMEKVGAVSEKN